MNRPPDTLPGGLPENTTVLECASYDEMALAIRDARISAHIVSREVRPWRLTVHRLGDAVLQHGIDGAAHGALAATEPGRTGFLLTGVAAAPRFCNGLEVDADRLLLWGAGHEVFAQSRRPGEWLALSVDEGALARATATFTGREPVRGFLSTALLRPAPSDLAAFRHLIASAFRALETAGPGGLHAEAARHLGATLFRAAAGLVCAGRTTSVGGSGWRRVDRRRLLSRFEDVLAENGSDPLYVPELCDRLGVPERTLRYIFVEQYGVSPVRVLRSRRLCQVREALLAARPGERVSQVAGRFGFWHLGQFASDYTELFGERPSETLRRAAGGPHVPHGPLVAPPARASAAPGPA